MSGGSCGGTDVLELIRDQLLYYFSKENLLQDYYLCSWMNEDSMVPLSVICQFKRIAQLSGDDPYVVYRALTKEIPSILSWTVDEAGEVYVGSVFSMGKRCTIVLRDVPENVEVSHIQELVPSCPIVHASPDIEGIWFVTFQTEDMCASAFETLRGKTLSGAPVKARVKAEARCFFSEWTAQAMCYSAMCEEWYMMTHDENGNPIDYRNRRRGHSRGHSRSRRAHSRRSVSRPRRWDRSRSRPRREPPQRLPTVSDFPPMAGSGVAKVGYTSSFKQYSKPQIIRLFLQLQETNQLVPDAEVELNSGLSFAFTDEVKELETIKDMSLADRLEFAGGRRAKKKSFAEAAIKAKDIHAGNQQAPVKPLPSLQPPSQQKQRGRRGRSTSGGRRRKPDNRDGQKDQPSHEKTTKRPADSGAWVQALLGKRKDATAAANGTSTPPAASHGDPNAANSPTPKEGTATQPSWEAANEPQSEAPKDSGPNPKQSKLATDTAAVSKSWAMHVST